MLSSAPYHYSAGTIGLFGLLGVAGALSASFAGRFADRGRAGLMTGVTAVVLLASWALIALGRHSLPLLIGGVIALDFATQGLHITNQSQIYRLRPEARSRITSAYMSLYFLGGVAGSVSAADAYARGGWAAVSVVGAAFSATAVLLWGVATTTATRSPNATRPI
jgi:predicted MFS family arabinose efflux permease